MKAYLDSLRSGVAQQEQEQEQQPEQYSEQVSVKDNYYKSEKETYNDFKPEYELATVHKTKSIAYDLEGEDMGAYLASLRSGVAQQEQEQQQQQQQQKQPELATVHKTKSIAYDLEGEDMGAYLASLRSGVAQQEQEQQQQPELLQNTNSPVFIITGDEKKQSFSSSSKSNTALSHYSDLKESKQRLSAIKIKYQLSRTDSINSSKSSNDEHQPINQHHRSRSICYNLNTEELKDYVDLYSNQIKQQFDYDAKNSKIEMKQKYRSHTRSISYDFSGEDINSYIQYIQSSLSIKNLKIKDNYQQYLEETHCTNPVFEYQYQTLHKTKSINCDVSGSDYNEYLNKISTISESLSEFHEKYVHKTKSVSFEHDQSEVDSYLNSMKNSSRQKGGREADRYTEHTHHCTHHSSSQGHDAIDDYYNIAIEEMSVNSSNYQSLAPSNHLPINGHVYTKKNTYETIDNIHPADEFEFENADKDVKGDKNPSSENDEDIKRTKYLKSGVQNKRNSSKDSSTMIKSKIFRVKFNIMKMLKKRSVSQTWKNIKTLSQMFDEFTGLMKETKSPAKMIKNDPSKFVDLNTNLNENNISEKNFTKKNEKAMKTKSIPLEKKNNFDYNVKGKWWSLNEFDFDEIEEIQEKDSVSDYDE